jgi:hypothetical protein
VSWDAQLAAAEAALRARVQAAQALEQSLEGQVLDPVDGDWSWFERHWFRERWTRRPWEGMVRPSPLYALGIFGIASPLLLCMGVPAASVTPWALIPVVLVLAAGSVLGAWLLKVLIGRQLLVARDGAVALVQTRSLDGRPRVAGVVEFARYGSGLPLLADRLLSEGAEAALAGGPATPEVLAELRLVTRLVQTRSAQLLASNDRIRGEGRERGLVWWHELSESLDRALELLGGPDQETGLSALRYLLLRIGPEVDLALRARRFPELPPPADWASVGEARVPAALLELRGQGG